MRNYKYSVPICIHTVTETTRDIYLSQMQEAKVDRTFFCFGGLAQMQETEFKNTAAALKKSIRYFNDNGANAAIWAAGTIGHGGNATNVAKDKLGYSLIRNARGEYVENTYCPLDDKFAADLANKIKELAKTGTKMIMLDDDYRLSQHSSTLCCCCEHHLKKMSEEYGEEVTLEKVNAAFKGGKNKLRDVWLKVQGDSLRSLAKKIRSAVDEVDENVCVSLAVAWSPFGADGADGIELTKILAGKNKPFLRLHGAPYWKKWWGAGWSISAIVEVARTLAHLCKNQGVELIFEGDCFPRPRYSTPASHLELFDAILRADHSADGILKYMVDYGAPPTCETGYLVRHIRNLPLNEKIAELFEGEQLGARVYVYKDIFEHMEIPDDFEIPYLNQIPRGDGALLTQNSIPTVYEGEGLCPVVLGENARHVPLSVLEKGGILDLRSALILKDRGVDVGIEKVDNLKITPFSIESDGKGVEMKLWNGACRRMKGELNNGAEAQSYDQNGDPASWRYENEKGQKFFVLNVDEADQEYYSSVNVNYLRQEQLVSAVEWISGKTLPAKCLKQPELHIKCAKTDGLVVGLFNCYDDNVTPAVITLDKAYSKAEFYGCNGRIVGDKVILDNDIPAYSYCAFKVFE